MAAIDDLISQISDSNLRELIKAEVSNLKEQKKFGLVFEDHLPESTPLYNMPIRIGSVVGKKTGYMKVNYEIKGFDGENAICENRITKETELLPKDELVCVAQFGEPIYPYLKAIDSVCNAPDSELWHTLIEADNYHALQLLKYLYEGKVDCIYIDPPYNTGAKDWKYNNDYVDATDQYRHSKWLSFMKKRLELARLLLNPKDSVLIVTIDEKEYLHLGCLLEELFEDAKIQMITDVINPRGTNRENEFSRVEEYIFVCRFGNASIVKSENNMLGNTDETGKARVWYAFNRGNNPRTDANGQFFPIYIDENKKTIEAVGEPMDLSKHPEDFPVMEGLVAAFPINNRGEESIWRAIPETTREWVKKGYVKLSKYDKKNKRWTLSYIPSGIQQRIESGEIEVAGKLEDGSLDIKHIDSSIECVSPRTVWYQQQHNATDYGASIIKKIIPNHKFAYPKSLYSVKDTLNFFVKEKHEALIVDFFAGSGTTLHAVNLLNAEDGGKRRCIMVTNNEVSADEAKALTKKGYKPCDEEWEKLGIARYVTWERTRCSIEGHDINGNALKGNYLGSDIPMADGFKANAAYFKLDFLDKNLVALGRQFRELLSVLWMKSGAVGKCPVLDGDELPDMLVLPQNQFAVLINETAFDRFVTELEQNPEIQTLFIVTDSANAYRDMIRGFESKQTYQLYKNYLDNFRINVVK